MFFSSYQTDGFFDEMFEAGGGVRAHARLVLDTINSLDGGQLLRHKHAAERLLLQLGITFNVYGDNQGTERIFPFDLIPRIVPAAEWDYIERGLKQRIHALNCFIDDIYHDQKIVKDGAIPAEVVTSAASYREQCHGLNPPFGVWCHITGTDLVRDSDGQYYVLEDNLRVPSGVSYVLENREVLKRIFPRVFEGLSVRPVNGYPSHLLEMLESLAPTPRGAPQVVVLTPGIYNSAYFEHSFLAQQMGVQLVEGRDLVVAGGDVFMRTTKGLQRVDVIYRRVDDDFLDPEAFRPDSLLGVPGLMAAYRAGRVALANAPGNGIADDKVIYAYVPEMIRYYENEDPILPNVPTYLCWRDTRPAARARQPGEAGGQIGQRIGRLRHAGGAALHRAAARGVRRQNRRGSAQLHRPAHAGAFPRSHHRGRSLRRPPRGPAALRALRQGDLRSAGRPDPRRHAQRLAGGQLVPGRRQQGYLGAGARSGPRAEVSNSSMPHSQPLLSRVAEAVYWMARYIERAENVARFLDVNHNLMIDLPLRLHRPVAAHHRHHRRQRALPRALPRGHPAERHAIPGLRSGVRKFNLLLYPRGARKCPFRARDHLLGDVAAGEQPVPADYRGEPPRPP